MGREWRSGTETEERAVKAEGTQAQSQGRLRKSYIFRYIYIYIRIHSDLSKMSTHVNAVVSHPSLVS